MADPDNVTRLRPIRPCPICKNPSSQAQHPFCSVRCANIDLNRWLNGAYVLPGRPEESEEEEQISPHIAEYNDEE